MSFAEDFIASQGNRYFQNIMPIDNISSVVKCGILSYQMAKTIQHISVALEDVQNRRAKIIVTNGMCLHSYANVYFHARNPMMYKRRGEANNLCVLCVTTQILDLSDVIVTDRNAASLGVRFLEPAQMMSYLDFRIIYASDWNRSDPFEKHEWSNQKCAEILVPDSIPYEYIVGAYVSCEESVVRMKEEGFDKPVAVKPNIFFK